MIPFYKLSSLFMRTFSRPIGNKIKRYTLSAEQTYLRKYVRSAFVFLGNKYHRFEVFIHRKFVTGSADVFVKPLTDEAAIQKGQQVLLHLMIIGADFISEFFIYGCLIGFPLYEMARAQRDADRKSKQKDQHMNQMSNELKEVTEIHQEIMQEHDKLKELHEQMIQKFEYLHNNIGQRVSTLLEQQQQFKEPES